MENSKVKREVSFSGKSHEQSVIEYLGRYTHKIAISNHRLLSVENGKVTFSYKDYRKKAQKLNMTLDAIEFIRRFSLHVLPKRFVRIRHYGILSSTSKKITIPEIKAMLPEGVMPKAADSPRWTILFNKGMSKLIKNIQRGESRQLYNPDICPHCNKNTMVTVERFIGRGPPPVWATKVKV